MQPVLASEYVRYVGEPIAVVVADSRHVAEDAAALIDVDIEPLPAVLDAEAAAAGGDFANEDVPDNLVLARDHTPETPMRLRVRGGDGVGAGSAAAGQRRCRWKLAAASRSTTGRPAS